MRRSRRASQRASGEGGKGEEEQEEENEQFVSHESIAAMLSEIEKRCGAPQ